MKIGITVNVMGGDEFSPGGLGCAKLFEKLKSTKGARVCESDS